MHIKFSKESNIDVMLGYNNIGYQQKNWLRRSKETKKLFVWKRLFETVDDFQILKIYSFFPFSWELQW